MRYYLFFFIMLTFLLIDFRYRDEARADTPLPTPDTCETNLIELDTIRGCIGSVKIDTIPTYKCEFPAWYYPSWNRKPKSWGNVIEISKK